MTILYLTDLYYQARDRNYYEEDLYITSQLWPHFNILIGHPQQALSTMDRADAIVFRNTGPVMKYRNYFQHFVQAVREKNKITFNSFDGKGDQKGKHYLVDLTQAGFPVIPTIEHLSHLDQLGSPHHYIVKLPDGADSIGMQLYSYLELMAASPEHKLIQPFIDFEYEVSFYFLNDQYQYALHAPDKTQRWKLQWYTATDDDLQFAQQFIRWNALTRGITRVDACRTKEGTLLLVELEDLNPFLSIDLLPADERQQFISHLIAALYELSDNEQSI